MSAGAGPTLPVPSLSLLAFGLEPDGLAGTEGGESARLAAGGDKLGGAVGIGGGGEGVAGTEGASGYGVRDASGDGEGAFGSGAGGRGAGFGFTLEGGLKMLFIFMSGRMSPSS